MARKKAESAEEDVVLDDAEVSYDEDAVEEDAARKVAKLKEELKQCQTERREYLDGWQRLKADTLNSKRRQEEEREMSRTRETALLVEKLLPLADSFELALKSGGEDGAWRTGMERIRDQLSGILTSYGLTEIAAEGEVFDPRKHEAVSEVPVEDESKDNVVTDVLQTGYALGERIVRPAKVVVGRFINT